MNPTKTFDLTELGKEEIGGLYFRSLGNAETRKTHAALVGWTTPRVSPGPSTHELELDFTCWYGGVRDIVRAIDPDAGLPALKEMVVYISENFDRVKAAIAA